MTVDLKPCPFCGSDRNEAMSESATVVTWHWLRCASCYADGPRTLSGKVTTREEAEAEAVEKWNDRMREPDK